MWLFASDETLSDAQRHARAHHPHQDIGDAARRREDLDDEREQRAHARFRAFAWLLFGPSLVIAVLGLALLVIRSLST